MTKTTDTTTTFDLVLLQLGGGEPAAGEWDEDEDEYLLAKPIRIKLTKCKNATQLGLRYDVRKLTRTKMFGRAVKFRHLYEILLSGTEFEVVT